LRLIDQQHDRQQAARADHNHMRGRGEVVSGFTHQAKEPMAMSRHIACLSFDLDAMSGWVARGMTTPTPISRGEFGNHRHRTNSGAARQVFDHEHLVRSGGGHRDLS
jgi:hypothetical protein